MVRRKKIAKITIVQSAKLQAMEKSTNPITIKKVVLGILELEIVTERDVGGQGISFCNFPDDRFHVDYRSMIT